MKSAAAVLTFVCVIASFQSCSSIKCYECFSKNLEDPECDKFLDPEYMLQCDEPAHICYKLWYITWLETEQVPEYGIMRKCGTNEYLLNLEQKLLRNANKTRAQFGLTVCNTDGCNGI